MAETIVFSDGKLGYYITPTLYLHGDRVYFEGGSRPATEEEKMMPDIYCDALREAGFTEYKQGQRLSRYFGLRYTMMGDQNGCFYEDIVLAWEPQKRSRLRCSSAFNDCGYRTVE